MGCRYDEAVDGLLERRQACGGVLVTQRIRHNTAQRRWKGCAVDVKENMDGLNNRLSG